MAVSLANIYASGQGGVSSIVTPSLSFGTNKLDLAIIFNQLSTSNTPTLSGATRTWTQIITATSAANDMRITVFRSMGSSASGAITIDFAGQTQTNIKFSFDEASNTDITGTNGSGAIVQSGSNTNTGTTTGLTVTLSAFGSVNNAAYGGVQTAAANAITTGAGFTSLVNDTGLFADSVEWEINNNAVAWTWGSQSTTALAGAIEIKAPVSTSRFFTVLDSF